MSKKLVIFDFDGVLVNTINLSFVLQKKHNPDLTEEAWHKITHGNFWENYQKAVADGSIIDPPNWDEGYIKGLLELNSHDVIQKLILDLQHEYTLVIVSSTSSSHIKKFLEQEKIEHCFEGIYGADTDYSKVVKINMLLKKFELVSTNAIFVTDTLGDIREGNECNVKSIGVTWGAHDRETLSKGEPYEIVDDVFGLEQAIYNFFNPKS